MNKRYFFVLIAVITVTFFLLPKRTGQKIALDPNGSPPPLTNSARITQEAVDTAKAVTQAIETANARLAGP